MYGVGNPYGTAAALPPVVTSQSVLDDMTPEDNTTQKGQGDYYNVHDNMNEMMELCETMSNFRPFEAVCRRNGGPRMQSMAVDTDAFLGK